MAQRLYLSANLLPIDSEQNHGLSDDPRLHLALGYRLVLVLQAFSPAISVDAAPVGERTAAISRVLEALETVSCLSHHQSHGQSDRRTTRICHPRCRGADRTCPPVCAVLQRADRNQAGLDLPGGGI